MGEGRRQLAQDLGRLAASDQHDLDAIRPAFDDELDITQGAAVVGVVVGRRPRFADRLAEGLGGLVDPGMMDGAVGCGDDAVAAGLEEADPGIRGRAADGEARAVAVGGGRRRVDLGLGETGSASETA